MIKTTKIFKCHSIREYIFLLLLSFITVMVSTFIAGKEVIYVVAFIGSIAYILVALKFPEMALAGFLAVNYVAELLPYIGFGMTRIFLGGVILGCVYYIAKSIKGRSVQIRMDTLQIINLIFTFWLLINLLVHVGSVETYGFIKFRNHFMYSLITFYAVTIFQNDPIRIERFVRFYVFILSFSSAIIYLIFGGSIEVQAQIATTGRYAAFGDSINFSLPFVSGVIMSVYLFCQTDKIYLKISALICTCIISFNLIMTGTRQSVIAAILGVMIFLYLMVNRRTFLIVLMVLSIMLWFYYPNIQEVQEGAFLNRYSVWWQDHIGSTQSRLFYYQTSFDLFLEFPITGVGLGEYGRHAVPGDPEAHTHNLMLELLSEEGLVGFLIFLGFLWYPIKKGVHIMRKLSRSDSRFTLVWLFLSILITDLIRSNISGGIGSRTILWFSVGALWVISTSKYQLKYGPNVVRSLK